MNFDMTGLGGVTNTRNIVRNSLFQSQAVINPIFTAISIAQSTGSNLENFQINNNFFSCSLSKWSGNLGPHRTTSLGTMANGSPNLNASDAPFTASMVGQTVWVSYPGSNGLLRTTIASFTDASHIVLNANAADAITNATVFVGQAYGTGIYLGPSGNDIHEQFDSNIVYNCDYGIYAAGGSFSMRHLQGGYGDYGVYIYNNWLQDSLDFYENETICAELKRNRHQGHPS